MKWLWYQIVKRYITLGLFFYYKKINCFGKNHIPKKGAVLFVCNHQNALIDPLILATNTSRNIHFLTRAGVFKKKLISKLFNSLQMIPIYRVRDGWSTLSKNEAVFEECYSILNNKKALLIFPEGSHNQIRKVRPLSKGFTRILFGAIEKYPALEIHIVPVGLNYSSVLNFPSAVSIYFGKPIKFNNDTLEADKTKLIKQLRQDVHTAMSKLTTHIDESGEVYDRTVLELQQAGVNFLNPVETNRILSQEKIDMKQQKNYSPNPLYYILILNSLIPWLLWKKVKNKIKEAEFISTFRFALVIAVFPIFYGIQSIFIAVLFNTKIGIYYFLLSILLGLLFIKTTGIQKK